MFLPAAVPTVKGCAVREINGEFCQDREIDGCPDGECIIRSILDTDTNKPVDGILTTINSHTAIGTSTMTMRIEP